MEIVVLVGKLKGGFVKNNALLYKTNEKLDKDRFRRDLGNVEEAYQEMMRRVFGA